MDRRTTAIIVDIDGTLANCEHRRHLVEAKKWPAFYDAMFDDTVNEWCKKLMEAMWEETCVDAVLLVSGRPDSHRSLTEQWLELHTIQHEALFMRRATDYRKDAIVKREIYEKEIKPKWDVLFVVDDRTQVVEMWRELGLVCLQCAKGDF